RNEKAATRLIEDGEGEHAAQLFHAGGAVLFVGVEDGFGIAMGGVAVSGCFQRGAKAGVIEDLAVEDDPLGTILIRHGLVAAAHVNDGETAETERAVGMAIDAGIIGAAMLNGGVHPLNHRGWVSGRSNGSITCNSTHGGNASRRSILSW